MRPCLALLVVCACAILDTAKGLSQDEINQQLVKEIFDLKRQFIKLEKQNEDLRSTIQHMADGSILHDNKSKRLLMTIAQSHKKAAFSASLSDHMTNLGNYQTIVFDNVFTNDGNVYSPLTGVFTAPRNGTYYFSTTIMSHFGQYLEAEISLNGKSLVKTYSKDSAHEQGTNSIVLALKEGDMVWVRKHGNEGTNVYGGHWSTFSGFQIS